MCCPDEVPAVTCSDTQSVVFVLHDCTWVYTPLYSDTPLNAAFGVGGAISACALLLPSVPTL